MTFKRNTPNGKGDKRRPGRDDLFASGFDRIFGSRDKSTDSTPDESAVSELDLYRNKLYLATATLRSIGEEKPEDDPSMIPYQMQSMRFAANSALSSIFDGSIPLDPPSKKDK